MTQGMSRAINRRFTLSNGQVSMLLAAAGTETNVTPSTVTTTQPDNKSAAAIAANPTWMITRIVWVLPMESR